MDWRLNQRLVSSQRPGSRHHSVCPQNLWRGQTDSVFTSVMLDAWFAMIPTCSGGSNKVFLQKIMQRWGFGKCHHFIIFFLRKICLKVCNNLRFQFFKCQNWRNFVVLENENVLEMNVWMTFDDQIQSRWKFVPNLEEIPSNITFTRTGRMKERMPRSISTCLANKNDSKRTQRSDKFSVFSSQMSVKPPKKLLANTKVFDKHKQQHLITGKYANFQFRG